MENRNIYVINIAQISCFVLFTIIAFFLFGLIDIDTETDINKDIDNLSTNLENQKAYIFDITLIITLSLIGAFIGMVGLVKANNVFTVPSTVMHIFWIIYSIVIIFLSIKLLRNDLFKSLKNSTAKTLIYVMLSITGLFLFIQIGMMLNAFKQEYGPKSKKKFNTMPNPQNFNTMPNPQNFNTMSKPQNFNTMSKPQNTNMVM